MLENLFNLVKENATDSVINNPVIPDEKNDAVVGDATHAVADGLQNELAGGGLKNILSLFQGGNGSVSASTLANNPIVGNIINSFKDKLTGNHGIESGQASGIANSLIPNVFSQLIQKTNDANNGSFDINSIIGSLSGTNTTQQAVTTTSTGGSGFDLQGLLSKFTGGGLDVNHDGHVGLDDLISKITGGAQQQQQLQNSGTGGGLMDTIRGFFK